MVFMEDSERAAGLASEHSIDCGLHLNFTTTFSRPGASAFLLAHQDRIGRFLLRSPFAQILFHPGLAESFRYVVAAQIDEFRRLYGKDPDRIDGHHHMHLCANVMFGKLIPAEIIVRRSFSFRPGEKSWMNRAYRSWVDGRLKRRHHLVDFLFSIVPAMRQGSLQTIVSLARHSIVELETHPVNPEEYQLLTSSELFRHLAATRVAPSFAASMRNINVASNL